VLLCNVSRGDFEGIGGAIVTLPDAWSGLGGFYIFIGADGGCGERLCHSWERGGAELGDSGSDTLQCVHCRYGFHGDSHCWCWCTVWTIIVSPDVRRQCF
jgi:hypothetical protein